MTCSSHSCWPAAETLPASAAISAVLLSGRIGANAHRFPVDQRPAWLFTAWSFPATLRWLLYLFTMLHTGKTMGEQAAATRKRL